MVKATITFLLCLIIATASKTKNFQTVYGPEFKILNVENVWKKGITGKGVVVAVVDDAENFEHHDLRTNYNKSLSFNFAKDSYPRRTSHGIKCAGIIAAAKRRGTCRTGIAYNAQIAGLKIFNSSFVYDVTMAEGFKYRRDEIHIYSNNWGPKDNGYTVKGPGRLVKEALQEGVREGRSGLGSIFVFSSGNGGFAQDSCAFDGYVNNIHTIAIGAVSKQRTIPHYVERCSAVMAAAYGDTVKTSDVSGCTTTFGRTSSAAAMAAGILALVLQANDKVTWREVQHLIVRTSNPNREFNGVKDWIVNGAGLLVHPAIGFGVMDADKLVNLTQQNWIELTEQKTCTLQYTTKKRIHAAASSLHIYTQKMVECSKIHYIEHVQVEVSLYFPVRASLEMYLVSPQGTKSQLLYTRVYDALTKRSQYKNLVLTSLHFWGENVTTLDGKWLLQFNSASFKRGAQGSFSKIKITFYGTEWDPILESSLTKGMIECPHGGRLGSLKWFWRGYGNKCCGTLGVYNEKRVECCEDKRLVEKNTLCGSRSYNKCTHMCCKKHIHMRNGINACCGEKVYDKGTEICCDNENPKPNVDCRYVYFFGGYREYEAVCLRKGDVTYRLNYRRCDAPPCASRPCRNRGKCHENGRNFKCTCLPGYHGSRCEQQVCKRPSRLGMENGQIKDSQITASSELGANYRAINSRLNFQAQGSRRFVWAPKRNDPSPWLQVNFVVEAIVTKILTQGRGGWYQWVTRYTVSYSHNGQQFFDYRLNGKPKEFNANFDRNTVVEQTLSPVIVTQYIRIHPIESYIYISMRVDFYGCLKETSCETRPCLNGKCFKDSVGYACACTDGWAGRNCNIDIRHCIPRNLGK